MVRGAHTSPDWLAAGTPEPLRSRLISALGREAVLDRPIDLVRFASDASPYRSIPKVVVQPRDHRGFRALFELARGEQMPVVFRAAGTSLMGQSQTDGILASLGKGWRGVEVLDEGERVRAGSGAILGRLNGALAPYGRRVGPDPSSVGVAKVGGIVANNAGGMRCGTTHDSYSTVSALSFTLPSGTTIDTAAPGAAERFVTAESALARGLAEIRDEIRADRELTARIRHKYEIKNTMGYRLAAFLDADEPLEIFRRLLIGSEGTLALVGEVTFETVPLPAETSVAWAHFPSVADAIGAVDPLVEAGASAVELMTGTTLAAALGQIHGAPAEWRALPPEAGSLLIELGGSDRGDLAAARERAELILADHPLLAEPRWSEDPELERLYWRVRHSLHGLAATQRPPGTALIVEDVCVRPEQLPDCAAQLEALLAEHGFMTLLAGHASAGNLHFFLTPDFGTATGVERYERFMESLVELICDRFDGSLKAEHGTGVNMAPFLEREWGARAVGLMRRVKELADPDGILGPGVVFPAAEDSHLQNLKRTPRIEPEVDGCVECGFCEPVCPSRDLTLTPKDRITVRREIERQGDSPLAEALWRDYDYGGLETCATDGICAHHCPLGIDTGGLVKRLRADRHGGLATAAADRVASRWEVAEWAARGALAQGDRLERRGLGTVPRAASRLARRLAGSEAVPGWVEPMPPPARSEPPPTERTGAAAVYFPACVNRIFGDEGSSDLAAAMVEVSRRAAHPLWIPDDVPEVCCGLPFSSKGFTRAHTRMAGTAAERLWEWTDGGALPVVVDASSCTLGLRELAGALEPGQARLIERIEIVDSIAWCEHPLLDGLGPFRKVRSATVHPTCSSRDLGLDAALGRVAARLAERVVVPATASCCGFAGDRGFLHPELVSAALAEEAAEVEAAESQLHLCSNRTCEIGLRRETGRQWESVVVALERLSRPAADAGG